MTEFSVGSERALHVATVAPLELYTRLSTDLKLAVDAHAVPCPAAGKFTLSAVPAGRYGESPATSALTNRTAASA
jgi:hypothetical protein